MIAASLRSASPACQLHHQMSAHHNVDRVGLHVRISNQAATQLYKESMGYEVEEVIKGYYQDGEDAYLMKKPLSRKATAGTALTVDGVFQEGLQRKRERQQKVKVVEGEHQVLGLPRILRGEGKEALAF